MGLLDRFSRKQRSQAITITRPLSVSNGDPEYAPFGYKTGWVAVRSHSADIVAGSLRLINLEWHAW